MFINEIKYDYWTCNPFATTTVWMYQSFIVFFFSKKSNLKFSWLFCFMHSFSWFILLTNYCVTFFDSFLLTMICKYQINDWCWTGLIVIVLFLAPPVAPAVLWLYGAHQHLRYEIPHTHTCKIYNYKSNTFFSFMFFFCTLCMIIHTNVTPSTSHGEHHVTIVWDVLEILTHNTLPNNIL